METFPYCINILAVVLYELACPSRAGAGYLALVGWKGPSVPQGCPPCHKTESSLTGNYVLKQFTKNEVIW